MKSVKRLDFQFIGKKVKTTSQGFLIIPAYTARTGLQTYLKDGKTIVEYRPEDEVFSESSMESLRTAAVTNRHPVKMVSPDNAKELIVGHTDGFIEKVTGEDGEGYLKTNIVVTHQEAIDAILKGRVELSNGYNVDLDFTPGLYKGQKYDAIQRNIINNHIALVDRARGGRNVRLRLDSNDVEIIEGETMKVTIKGKEFDVAEEIGTAINEALGELETSKKDSKELKDQVTKITSEKEALVAKVDSLESDLEKEKKTPKTVQMDDDKFNSAVQERVSVLEFGKKVLGSEKKVDEMSNFEIKKEVIKKDSPNVDEKKLENETYVSARFDHIQENFASDASKNLGKEIIKNKAKQDGEDANKTYVSPDQKRLDAMEKAQKESVEGKVGITKEV